MDLEKVKKLNIPETPGCYLYYNAKGGIIYVGKAVNLKSRILSYWHRGSQLNAHKEQMVGEVVKIKWILVDSEIEAFLLEANLIKKHLPKYNISSRDDKRFMYIKISTEEEWPRIYTIRTIDKAGKYFGPFKSGEAVRETLKLIRRIWPYRSCARLPKKVCLFFHVGKCTGVCEEKITKKDYLDYIKQVIKFLEGKKKDIVKDINREIRGLVRQLKEKNLSASQIEALENKRNLLEYRLFNINRVLEMSRVLSVGEKYANDVVELAKLLGLEKVPDRIEGYDISNIFGQEAVGSMIVFSGGEPDRSEYRKFKIKAENLGFEFRSKGGDVKMLEEVLERRFRRYDSVVSEIKDAAVKSQSPYKKSFELINGKLKYLNLRHDLAPKSGDKNAWPIPDMIVIDGGKAQLNVASRVLKRHHLEIPVIGISKGEGLRSAKAPDKLFFAGEKTALELPLASPALHLIKRVRDEAHRFAIGYHKLLRKKKFISR